MEEGKLLEIIIKNQYLGEIPVLELYSINDTGIKPMVLLYHGYLGRKEFILPQAYNLASNGFYVVVPDAVGHGDRSGHQTIDLLTAIIKTTEEIDGLIDSFQEHPLADNTSVGLAGYSMGGCITFSYLVSGRRQIKAAVPIISTPEWTSIVDSFSTEERIKELKAYGIIEKDEDLIKYRAQAEKIQPINYYQCMKDIPLLILCGEADNVTPFSGVKKLYEKLEPLTADKETLRYKVYAGVGHTDTVEMNMEMVDWMKKHVVKQLNSRKEHL